ncbi:MAG TPA: hydantoinase B/oxoprolinase family protein, partial [Dehalococcoidia bacterium]|nr:hydantoinase B/oxoprolinase family protein [Dehalococcoidia bacterium]
LFSSVADEMGVTLGRTAHSPNIKERRDYSCAVFDPAGRLVAQAAHIPVHLGAIPESVRAAMRVAHPEVSKGRPEPVEGFQPGDIVILNDPYLGGTHLPDITLVSPVFDERAPFPAHPEVSMGERSTAPAPTLTGFLASRAHHADVGGISPGSMPIAEELIQEGIVIPPIRLYDAGRLNQAVLDLLLRNMRNPAERRGDLDAQIAAHRTGESRLREIAGRFGLARTALLMNELMDYAERMTRAAIAALPDGEYTFEDALDDDGADVANDVPSAETGATRHSALGTEHSIPIRVRITVAGDSLHADFTGSAPERPTSINAVAAVTRSAVYYCVRCLLDEAVPSNDGCFRPVTLTLPERSVVNAGPPRAVAAGNVETSQRIVDVVLGALAKALPDLIPAASQGTMNNITIGGQNVILRHEGAGAVALATGLSHPPLPAHPEVSKGRADPNGVATQFAYYETIGGGAGASPSRDGLHAVHTHMTNTLNTPVEALEMTYPFRVVEYTVRRGSGGNGRHRGGDGTVRTYEFLSDSTITLLTERRRLAPWGLAGGEAGDPGRNTLVRASAQADALPSKTTLRVHPGDRLTIETPGGGGWGSA